VIRYLRAGKSPKEIGILIHKSTATIWLMAHRYEEVKQAYRDTYPLRYPHRAEEPPVKFQKAAF
jgi:hypothetical protein